ncbi:MAG: hypothetical protein U0269_31485 [Polyangiales bacterium]
MNRTITAWLALFAALLVFGRSARAQESLSIGGGTANFGVRELRATRPGQGRIDTSVRTGGTLSVRGLNLNERCVGWVTREPDLILRVMTPTPALRVWVESSRDTTLVINTHDGRWRCDDDSAGNSNPQVLLDEAGVGQYDIWVGSFARGVAVQGVLHVEPVEWVNPANGTIATAGVVELPANFAPEPRTISLPAHAAGTFDARWIVPGCWGRITAAPDAILRVSAGMPTLRVSVPQSDPGAQLVVRGPDRQWRCQAANRPLTVDEPAAGAYHLWIAQRIPYPTYISPRPNGDGGVTDGSFGTPEVSPTMAAARIEVSRTPLLATGVATGTLATHEISAGFAPDPLVVPVADRAPGPVNAVELGVYGCIGHVNRQPDVVLRVQSTLTLLRVFATAQTDTTLVIHGPSGWRCRDDMFGFNPGVDFTDAAIGQYEIWLGSYNENEHHAGSISITSSPTLRPVDPNQPNGNGSAATTASTPATTPGIIPPPPPPRVGGPGATTSATQPTSTTTVNAQIPTPVTTPTLEAVTHNRPVRGRLRRAQP